MRISDEVQPQNTTAPSRGAAERGRGTPTTMAGDPVPSMIRVVPTPIHISQLNNSHLFSLVNSLDANKSLRLYMLAAAKRGDIETLRRTFKETYSITDEALSSTSLELLLLQHGCADVFEILLDQNPGLTNLTVENGNHVIFKAYAEKNYSLVAKLLALDPRLIDIKMVNGTKPRFLDCVISQDDVELLRHICRIKPALLNLRPENIFPKVVSAGGVECAKWLYSKNHHYIRGVCGIRALCTALLHGRESMARFLLHACKNNAMLPPPEDPQAELIKAFYIKKSEDFPGLRELINARIVMADDYYNHRHDTFSCHHERATGDRSPTSTVSTAVDSASSALLTLGVSTTDTSMSAIESTPATTPEQEKRPSEVTPDEEGSSRKKPRNGK